MPSLGMTGLIMAYVALAILLLSLHLYANWNWWAKALVTLVCGFFYFIAYVSLPPLTGWPTKHNIPEKFRLIAYSVDKQHGVYIWANEMRNGEEVATPRAYVLPYSDRLVNEVKQAGEKMKKGDKIVGEIGDAPTSAMLQNAERGSLRSDQLNITFISTPAAEAPKKN